MTMSGAPKYTKYHNFTQRREKATLGNFVLKRKERAENNTFSLIYHYIKGRIIRSKWGTRAALIKVQLHNSGKRARRAYRYLAG